MPLGAGEGGQRKAAARDESTLEFPPRLPVAGAPTRAALPSGPGEECGGFMSGRKEAV